MASRLTTPAQGSVAPGPDTPDPAEALLGGAARRLDSVAREALEALIAERDRLKRALAEAETLADRDALTNTLNRRAFMRELHRTLSTAERYGTPAAVLYIDLDGFKRINDGHGHAAGDAALKHVARLLRDQLRESDIVGRIGGDEFAIILNHASLEDARRKAEALERLLAGAPVVHAGVKHIVGASIGVHACRDAEDPETALARADEAMYAEKWARKAARG
ncbi:MAG: GGDEF domain-containing protein [Hyphomonadaceae bacterium]|nr:GGDEF domain-containing protein [Hyphomonadaceae bacterium]